MSSPSFSPALGSHHTVILPKLFDSASEPGDVALSFTARNAAIGENDVIEIWTDAPDKSGEAVEGDWRAVDFDKFSKTGYGGDFEGIGKVFKLDVSIQQDHSSVADSFYYAKLVLPAKPTSFGFTFRIKWADGNISWLGDSGGNGSVTLASEADVEKSEESLDGVLTWTGKGTLGFEPLWEGFGVQVGEGMAPDAHILPTATHTPLTFAFLQPSPRDPPFAVHIPSSSSTPSLTILPTPGSSILFSSEAKGPSLASMTTAEPSAWISRQGSSAISKVLANHPASAFEALPVISAEGVIAVALSYSSHIASPPENLIIYTSPTLPGLSATPRIGVKLPSSLFGRLGDEKIALFSDHMRKAVFLDGLSDQDVQFIMSGAEGRPMALSVGILPMLSIPGGKGFIAALSKAKIAFIAEKTKDETYEAEEEVTEYIEAPLTEDTKKPVPTSTSVESGIQSDSEFTASSSDTRDTSGSDAGAAESSVTSVSQTSLASENADQETIKAAVERSAIVQTEPEQAEDVEEHEEILTALVNEHEDDVSSDKKSNPWWQLFWMWLKSGFAGLIMWFKGIFGIQAEMAELAPEVGLDEEAESRGSIDHPTDEIEGETDAPSEVTERTPLLSGLTTLVGSPERPTKILNEDVVGSEAIKIQLVPVTKVVKVEKTKTITVPAHLIFTFTAPPAFLHRPMEGTVLKFAKKTEAGEWEELTETDAGPVGENLHLIKLTGLDAGEIKVEGIE